VVTPMSITSMRARSDNLRVRLIDRGLSSAGSCHVRRRSS
jgi:hypothetical protein